jgi:GNAT superfamily N-acetyltransferase
VDKQATLLDAIVDLDMALLKDHTAAAGDQLDRNTHRHALAARFDIAEIVDIWRGDQLVAYSTIWPKDKCWFVGGFAMDPAHRNAAILGELMVGLLAVVKDTSQEMIESHVYKTNKLSMAFHKRLGFDIIQENEKGVAFSQSIARLATHPVLRRFSASH